MYGQGLNLRFSTEIRPSLLTTKEIIIQILNLQNVKFHECTLIGVASVCGLCTGVSFEHVLQSPGNRPVCLQEWQQFFFFVLCAFFKFTVSFDVTFCRSFISSFDLKTCKEQRRGAIQLSLTSITSFFVVMSGF